MKKVRVYAAVFGAAAISALGLVACGGSSSSEGGTLTGTYSSFPDFLDPALSYSMEGWTAMYNTYLPLLTYAHADGEAGSAVVPGLAKSLPKISDDGKTYTLQLRPGLKYSNGQPVKASDFTHTLERSFKLNSPGSPFYESIVGATKFAETKTGGIPGIETDDKTGKIVIHLIQPRGSFSNELGMLFVALLPAGTPAEDLTANPPPATGPYVITKSQPGRGWEYARNPQWAKANGEAMPDLEPGHFDKIKINVGSNDATVVNDVEQGKVDWMQAGPPPDRYAEVKAKYEGTQFRIEKTISNYFFWMNTTRAPFDDLEVRKAINYAIDTDALERIYTGQLAANQQILPVGMPGHVELDLYPHDLAKAKEMIAKADPADRDITVWTNGEPENKEAGEYYEGVLQEIGFDTTLKVINADQLLHGDRQPLDAGPRHGLVELVPGLPQPQHLLPAAAERGKHPAEQQHEPRRDRRAGAEREDRQARRGRARARAGSRIRRARQGLHGTGPLGPLRLADDVDLRLQRDRPRQGDLQPDLRPGPDELRAQVRHRAKTPGAAFKIRRVQRFFRNPVAMAFLGLFALIVVFVLAAPLWADHVAHTGPNQSHTLEQLTIDGEKRDVVNVEGQPIGPVWLGAGGKFFLGADSRLGRDEMVRLMYGGRTSLLIGISAALLTTFLAVVLGLLAGYYRGWVDAADLPRPRRDLVDPGVPAGARAGHIAGRRRAQARPDRDLRWLALDPDPDHRHRLRALHRASDPRPGALAGREGVRRGGDRPGRRAAAGDVR